MIEAISRVVTVGFQIAPRGRLRADDIGVVREGFVVFKPLHCVFTPCGWLNSVVFGFTDKTRSWNLRI